MAFRLRQAFKREDSYTASAPTLGHVSEDIELDDTKEKLDAPSSDGHSKSCDRSPTHGPHVSDPSALTVNELDPSNLLADGSERPIETDKDFSTRLVSLDDDPSLPIHTVRMYVLGLGLTCFAAVLGQIFYFRPQSLTVSSLFILVITHVLGRLWETVVPTACEHDVRHLGPLNASCTKLLNKLNPVWAVLNPCAFNQKEHCAVLIMCTTAFSSALAISVFAADDLYYDLDLNWGIAIFTLISSQFLGYGLAGLMRALTVFPSYAYWPQVLPTVQLFQLLHNDKDVQEQRKRQKFFFIVAVVCFVWEWLPEFIAPTLTGVSIFCLAGMKTKADNVWWSRVFGGSYPNQGMALFSLTFDWSYLSGYNALYSPLEAQLSLYAGIALCIVVTCATYYGNVWNAQNFPFLAQDLFFENGSVYDQSLILDADYNLNRTLLEEYGLPWQTTSMALYYLGCNLGIGATITHVLLWHWKDMKDAVNGFRSGDLDDPHYQVMKKNYKEVPLWVYGGIYLGSFAMAMAVCYTGHSHLPWYGVIVAFVISMVLFPFIAIFPAVTGQQIPMSTLMQMLGAAVKPGNTQANMWFTLFSSNSSTQGINLTADLKLASYVKLPPRTTLWVQSLGTFIGGLLQIVIAKQILSTKRDILLDVAGTAIWSGQNIQSANSQAVTWGALAKDLYGYGSTYFIVPMGVVIGLGVPILPWLIHQRFPKLRMDLFVTPLFAYTIGFLSAGINSGTTMAVCIAIGSQYFWRKYRPTSFRKYNYILSAGLDAGMQFFVFIFTFAISGAGNGVAVSMPSWALNPADINPDYCGTY